MYRWKKKSLRTKIDRSSFWDPKTCKTSCLPTYCKEKSGRVVVLKRKSRIWLECWMRKQSSGCCLSIVPDAISRRPWKNWTRVPGNWKHRPRLPCLLFNTEEGFIQNRSYIPGSLNVGGQGIQRFTPRTYSYIECRPRIRAATGCRKNAAAEQHQSGPNNR